MQSKDTKNINIEVSFPIWKKLKILSIQQDITLQEVVSNILEKYTDKKKDLLAQEE